MNPIIRGGVGEENTPSGVYFGKWRGTRVIVALALSDGRGPAPLDHHDLHGVVDNQARDHGIGENRESMRPRQWHESWKTEARQESASERIRQKGDRKSTR